MQLARNRSERREKFKMGVKFINMGCKKKKITPVTKKTLNNIRDSFLNVRCNKLHYIKSNRGSSNEHELFVCCLSTLGAVLAGFSPAETPKGIYPEATTS